MEHFINTDLSSSSVKGAVSSEGGSEGWVYEHQGGTQELPACMLAGVGIISLFWDVSKFLQNSFDTLTGYNYPHICLHRFVCLIQVQSDHLKVTSRTTRNCWSKILTRHPFQ